MYAARRRQNVARQGDELCTVDKFREQHVLGV